MSRPGAPLRGATWILKTWKAHLSVPLGVVRAAIPNALVNLFSEKVQTFFASLKIPLSVNVSIFLYVKTSKCIVDTFSFIVLQKGIRPFQYSLPPYSLFT